MLTDYNDLSFHPDAMQSAAQLPLDNIDGYASAELPNFKIGTADSALNPENNDPSAYSLLHAEAWSAGGGGGGLGSGIGSDTMTVIGQSGSSDALPILSIGGGGGAGVAAPEMTAGTSPFATALEPSSQTSLSTQSAPATESALPGFLAQTESYNPTLYPSTTVASYPELSSGVPSTAVENAPLSATANGFDAPLVIPAPSSTAGGFAQPAVDAAPVEESPASAANLSNVLGQPNMTIPAIGPLAQPAVETGGVSTASPLLAAESPVAAGAAEGSGALATAGVPAVEEVEPAGLAGPAALGETAESPESEAAAIALMQQQAAAQGLAPGSAAAGAGQAGGGSSLEQDAMQYGILGLFAASPVFHLVKGGIKIGGRIFKGNSADTAAEDLAVNKGAKIVELDEHGQAVDSSLSKVLKAAEDGDTKTKFYLKSGNEKMPLDPNGVAEAQAAKADSPGLLRKIGNRVTGKNGTKGSDEGKPSGERSGSGGGSEPSGGDAAARTGSKVAGEAENAAGDAANVGQVAASGGGFWGSVGGFFGKVGGFFKDLVKGGGGEDAPGAGPGAGAGAGDLADLAEVAAV